ncbi:Sigma factor RpoE negative regulatory protein RseB precursor [Thioalkalivibrio nitratireducens DSM 14787]|uniref:Sigma factor RpoE negative regulatory protein RseB n=1 Tax=Thioalkalivibrio nitratireducens (strain DSM 14787 / UNIQEM 213 / ALEN2) TaxID=1255043 RepID=L0DVZ2_THIND|nr:MucB/RseB C-terminal domain-containing protein [Thioalkalivibrio nitratireducens]AGA32511.1 Sigma factor RpoE negative regulatory protein RseB precursor [Thioalkalivibrio nitratireducens DSM 14787]
MWGWVRNLPVMLLLVLPAASVGDEGDPVRWLERMTESLHLQSYEGTFVFQRGDRIDTVRVVHAAEEGGYRERLQTLTGSAREVVRSVDRLSVLKGARAEGEGAGEGAPQWPPAIAGALVRANDRYHLKSPGFDRIAGFPCYLLHAKARDELRYSHKYCLHRETGLPLLSELIDASGQLLERMVFTELEFLDVVFEDALQARGCDARHIDVRVPSEDALQEAAHEKWLFEDLPPGFAPVIATERSFGPNAPPSLHFVLSDGLATVSVYVDVSGEVSETFEGATRSGATHAVARPLAGHQLTVVGEVPRQTVEWIAGSARYLGDDGAGPGP